MKNLLNNKTLTYLLWAGFGVLGACIYYSKKEYWISGLLALLGIGYAFRIVKSFRKNEKNTL